MFENSYKAEIIFKEEETNFQYPLAHLFYDSQQEWVRDMVRLETQLKRDFKSNYTITYKTKEGELYLGFSLSEIDAQCLLAPFIKVAGSLEALKKEAKASFMSRVGTLVNPQQTYP